jgi:hypothetical protein
MVVEGCAEDILQLMAARKQRGERERERVDPMFYGF